LLSKQKPNEFKRFVKLGDEARDGRDWTIAAQHYKAALLLEPETAGIQVQLGHCLKEAGDLDEAEVAYLRALQITPADVDLQVQLGHFYKLRGDYSKALKHYRVARLHGSCDVHMLNYLAEEEKGFPFFDFQFTSLSRPRKKGDAVVFSIGVELDGISKDEFCHLAQHRNLRFGCRVYAETSDSPVIAEERGAVAEDKSSATSLIIAFSLSVALFIDRPYRLISLNCVYDGKFWFSDRGRPPTYTTIGVNNSEKLDLFQYYLENFNNGYRP
jgi:tetratricopeptide (TPR) repeat protein